MAHVMRINFFWIFVLSKLSKFLYSCKTRLASIETGSVWRPPARAAPRAAGVGVTRGSRGTCATRQWDFVSKDCIVWCITSYRFIIILVFYILVVFYCLTLVGVTLMFGTLSDLPIELNCKCKNCLKCFVSHVTDTNSRLMRSVLELNSKFDG